MLRRLAVAAVFGFAVFAHAGLAPENVAVVVNGDSWASWTVANRYAKLRGIPDSNFVVLHHLSSVDVTDVDRFREEILKPVMATLVARDLANQIDCVTYSVDIPYAATTGSDMAGKKFPQIITGMASTNGLTYLHEWVSKKDTDYLRLDINRYMRRLLPLPIGKPLTAAEQTEYANGMAMYDAKKYPEAIGIMAKLLEVDRTDPNIPYNLTCCYALAGKPQEAIETLRRALKMGWRNHGQTTSDPDLASLRNRDDFREIVDKMRAIPVAMQPPVGFRSKTKWDLRGQAATEGPRYLLSTMLGVTCGRGNSVNEVLECLSRAARADFTAPKGTIYFPKNGDVRSTTREWGFEPAVAALKALGINARVENGQLPNHHDDVAGAMVGTSDFNWESSGSTMLPGAIVEHLTSFGGIITERAGQTPCTEFIRNGAAGSSGTVTEPFALQEKFPTPFMHAFYAQGYTLAEAFYLSLYGPYQLLIIGDPLCRPWAKPMNIVVSGITARAVVKGAVKVRATASRAVLSFAYYVDGRLAFEGAPGVPVALVGLTDGAHLLSVVGIDKTPAAGCFRKVIPFTIANNAKKVSITLSGSNSVSVAYPGAKEIDVFHLGEIVGTVKGDRGTVHFDPSTVGFGEVKLHAIARDSSHVLAISQPVTTKIDEPALIESAPLGSETKLKSGMELRVGTSDTTIDDTIDPNWLARRMPAEDTAFTLIGYFDVPVADLYQIQIKTNTGAIIDVDGTTVLTAKSEAQAFAPAYLSKGRHRLIVRGVANNRSTMDVRLGAKGALHPAASWFHRVVR